MLCFAPPGCGAGQADSDWGGRSHMGKRIGAIVMTVGTAALAAGLSAAPSFAATATTWSVSPGGTVKLIPSGRFTLTDTVSGKSLVCGHTNGSATFKSGRGLSGAGIGSITALTFASCTGPNAQAFTVKAGHLPWKLNAQTYNPAITGGLTTGTVTGIHATLSASGCHATVDGTSATAGNGKTQIHYHNSLAKLKIRTDGSNLHAYNASGCAGLIKSGDAITFSIAYIVSPAQKIVGS
jgi:hypothetical protein